MKNIFWSSIAQKLLITSAVCSLFFLTNCGGGIVDSLERYSGESLYESSVQAGGDVLGFVPDIQSEVAKHLKTKKQKHKFETFQKEFIKKLVRENPSFARDFHDKMHSGDRDQIDEALKDAGEIVEEELRDFTGESDFDAEDVVNTVLKKYEINS